MFMSFLKLILFYMIVGMVIHVLWLIDWLFKGMEAGSLFKGKNKLNNKNQVNYV